jgi:hypothetical protein
MGSSNLFGMLFFSSWLLGYRKRFYAFGPVVEGEDARPDDCAREGRSY